MYKPTILAVDDEPFNLDLIELTFMDLNEINIIKAVNGKDVIKKLQDNEVDTVLLDLRMPIMDGLECLEYLKQSEEFKDIPVIVITANSKEKHKALKLGANDFLSKPVDTEELKLRTMNSITLYQHKKHLNTLVEQRTQELSKALQFAQKTEYEISYRLGLASEYRDLETGGHIKRMSRYSALLGRLYGLSEEEENLLLYSSPLHDIGKIGIPDAILTKPGKLTVSEFEIMKQHSTIGAKMLEGADEYPIIKMGRIIALEHHEKWDGSGYPYGKQEKEIHIFARIVAIADVFDALSSKRPYKDAFPLDKTLMILREGRGTHFDPELLDLFLNNLDEFLKIQKEFSDKDETPHILNLLEQYR
jgi:putative two-component system response regulator